MGRYIVRYTVRNLVLRLYVSGAVERDFRTYIRRYTTQNKNNNMVIPILMNYQHFPFIKTVKMYFVAPICPADDAEFATVYHRTYCHKFMTLSNQTSRYICKCIRMYYYIIRFNGNSFFGSQNHLFYGFM